jgi:hypothetical protein
VCTARTEECVDKAVGECFPPSRRTCLVFHLLFSLPRAVAEIKDVPLLYFLFHLLGELSLKPIYIHILGASKFQVFIDSCVFVLDKKNLFHILCHCSFCTSF